MTGEVFDLLMKHSILGKLMEKGTPAAGLQGEQSGEEQHWEAFDFGVVGPRFLVPVAACWGSGLPAPGDLIA